MKKQERQDWIEKYLERKMSGSERERFEAELKINPDLSDEYSKNILERESVKLLIEDEYKDKIRAWRKDSSKVQILPNEKLSRRWWSIAASIAIIISLSLFFLFKTDNTSQWVADLYVEADDARTRGSGAEMEADFRESKRAFFDGRYKEALVGFETILKNNGQDIDALYYMAHTAMKMERYELATQTFEQLLNFNSLPANLARVKIEWNWLLGQAAQRSSGELLITRLNSFAQRNPAYQNRIDRLKEKL